MIAALPKQVRALSAALICALMLAPPVHAAEAVQDHWQYTIRPGDDLWTLAKNFCGSARLAEQIASYNNLANPAAVRAGTRIRLPVDWLVFAPSEARLIALNGDVFFLTDNLTTTSRRKATSGQGLPMGSLLVTEQGSALVEFADGSNLTVQPNSRVLFNKLTAFGPAGMVDTHLRFVYGRGSTRVEEQNRGDRFRIETPEGIAAVRGTVFRVGYSDAEGTATTETLEGEVAFVSPDKTLSVPGGFGVAASAGALTKEALLPAPQIFAQESVGNGDELSWSPVVGASRYAVTWSLTNTPGVSVAVSYHDGPAASVSLAPGRYLAEVRAVSAAGIEGQDAQTEFTVLATAPKLKETRVDPNLPVLLDWVPTLDGPYGGSREFVVELTHSETLQQQLHTTGSSTLSLDLPPGRYSYRVRGDDSAWSESQDFVRLPRSPTGLNVDRKRRSLRLAWDQSDSAHTYRIEVTGPSGQVNVIETAETQAIIDVDEYGAHVISLASVQNSLQSKAVISEETVSRRPWWLLALLVVFAL